MGSKNRQLRNSNQGLDDLRMSAHLRFLHLRNIIVRLVFGRGNFNFIQNKTKQDQEDDD